MSNQFKLVQTNHTITLMMMNQTCLNDHLSPIGQLLKLTQLNSFDPLRQFYLKIKTILDHFKLVTLITLDTYM